MIGPPPMWTAIPVGIALGLVVAWITVKIADWYFKERP